ncbi:S-adenosyl-methyltransferase MraW [Gorgonomyces haynaldii]|nr:S-adenosyl-methyltransferase MraW [Gorgonomyces haynaldii]
MKTHVPVLLEPLLERIQPLQRRMTIVDCTYGAGGYTRALLDKFDCQVIALDQDPQAIERAHSMALGYPNRLFPVHGNFGQLKHILEKAGYSKVDGCLFDIGVSTNQLEDGERGFSFRIDGPLDMRMLPDASTIPASTIVNQFSEERIAEILKVYGEERQYRKIARAICTARNKAPILSTLALANLIADAMGRPEKWMHGRNHPAAKSFQAFRIAVNDELGQFYRGLVQAEHCLEPNGFLGLVTFHSLEDRLAKKFLKACSLGYSNTTAASALDKHVHYKKRLLAEDLEAFEPSMVIEKKAIVPTPQEVERNPRSRSAKLRWAQRTNAPALHDLSNSSNLLGV